MFPYNICCVMYSAHTGMKLCSTKSTLLYVAGFLCTPPLNEYVKIFQTI